MRFDNAPAAKTRDPPKIASLKHFSSSGTKDQRDRGLDVSKSAVESFGAESRGPLVLVLPTAPGSGPGALNEAQMAALESLLGSLRVGTGNQGR